VVNTTDEPAYRFRLSKFRRETTYRLTPDALAWSEGEPDGALAFADIRRIRVYDSVGANAVPDFKQCTITPTKGRAITLNSNHFGGFANWESRTARFEPFVDALLRHAALANPRIGFISGMPVALWIAWLVILAVICLVLPLGIAVVVIEGHEMSLGLLVTLSACLAMVLAFFPLLRMVRRNKPRRFDGSEGYPKELSK
jgi:hypothetical protein